MKGAVIMAEGKQITIDDLGLPVETEGFKWLNLREARLRAEGEAVRQAMAFSGGNMSRAADLLGITRPTLYDLMEKLGMRAADDAAAVEPAQAPASGARS